MWTGASVCDAGRACEAPRAAPSPTRRRTAGGAPRRPRHRGRARPGQRPPPPAAVRLPHPARHAATSRWRELARGHGAPRTGRRRRPRACRAGRPGGPGRVAAGRGDHGRRPPPHLAGRASIRSAWPAPPPTPARELGARLVFVRGSAGDDPDAAATIGATRIAVRSTTVTGCRSRSAPPACTATPAPPSTPWPRWPAPRAAAAHPGQRGGRRGDRAATGYGRRPLDLLDEWGWLAPDVTLAHLCEITPAERARLAHAGVSATHAPGCDLPMGWGVRRRAPCSTPGVRGRAGHQRRRVQRRRAPPGRRPTRDAGLPPHGPAPRRPRGARHGHRGRRGRAGPPRARPPRAGCGRRPGVLRRRRRGRRGRGRPPRRPGVGRSPVAGPATWWWAARWWCATACSSGATSTTSRPICAGRSWPAPSSPGGPEPT